MEAVTGLPAYSAGWTKLPFIARPNAESRRLEKSNRPHVPIRVEVLRFSRSWGQSGGDGTVPNSSGTGERSRGCLVPRSWPRHQQEGFEHSSCSETLCPVTDRRGCAHNLDDIARSLAFSLQPSEPAGFPKAEIISPDCTAPQAFLPAASNFLSYSRGSTERVENTWRRSVIAQSESRDLPPSHQAVIRGADISPAPSSIDRSGQEELSICTSASRPRFCLDELSPERFSLHDTPYVETRTLCLL